MKWITFTTLLFIGVVLGEINLENLEIPDIDDVTVIKERCESKGGKGTYEKVKTAKETFQTCMQGIIDVTALKNEVEESKKTGSMDEVFGKYCAKRPKVKSCVTSLTDTITPCLEDEEKNALNITLDILKQLGEFVCYRDGDRIAMFVAEGGVECITEHTEDIKNCVNSTLKISPSTTPNSLPNLLIDKKKCDDLGKLQTCVVEKLEKCKDSTPANIVDALFRFIKRSACATPKTRRSIHSVIKREANLHKETYLDAISQLKKEMEEKCNENAPNGGYEAFETSFNSTRDCIKLGSRTHKIFVTPLNDVKKYIQDCSKDLVVNFENCLPPTQKFYPQLYLDSIYSVIDFFYQYQSKMTDRVLGVELLHCFQNFKTEEGQEALKKCSKKKFTVSSISDKQTTCNEMEEVKICISQEIDKRCINDVAIVRLKNDFFEALTAPCHKKNVS